MNHSQIHFGKKSKERELSTNPEKLSLNPARRGGDADPRGGALSPGLGPAVPKLCWPQSRAGRTQLCPKPQQNLDSTKIPGPSNPPDHGNKKNRDPLPAGIGAPSFWKLLLYIPENKGLQIKDNARSCACGHLWKSAQESHKTPHFSENRNPSTKPLIHTIPTLNHSFPSKINSQE